MTDDIYPACLRRPNAGGHVQTRTAKTEQRYRARFSGMIKTLCRQKHWTEADARDLADDLGERAFRYTRNTLAQYHAAIRQNLRDRLDQGSITLEEVNHIDALLQAQDAAPGRSSKLPQTSAGRARSAKPEQIAAIVAVLLRNPTPIRQIAAGMLDYGVDLATRPSEFLSARFDPSGNLWVKPCKHSETNGRALQPARQVPTDNLAPFEVAELRDLAALIAAERTKGATTPTLLRSCQRAIRLARAEVAGRSRRITAYTARQQARANLAAMGLTPEEVAVIMGHASAATAQSHYAPARRAWKGMKAVRPPLVDPDLVAMVRPIHPSRARLMILPPTLPSARRRTRSAPVMAEGSTSCSSIRRRVRCLRASPGSIRSSSSNTASASSPHRSACARSLVPSDRRNTSPATRPCQARGIRFRT
jgi:integrase